MIRHNNVPVFCFIKSRLFVEKQSLVQEYKEGSSGSTSSRGNRA